MPDLYGQTMCAALPHLKALVSEEEWNQYYNFNWFINDISKFIYQTSEDYKKSNVPTVPQLNSDTIWGKWFNSVIDALKEEFYDANRLMAFRCLENCPHEDVAIIIFGTIKFECIQEYLMWLSPQGAVAPQTPSDALSENHGEGESPLSFVKTFPPPIESNIGPNPPRLSGFEGPTHINISLAV